jgi:hypothetical protein
MATTNPFNCCQDLVDAVHEVPHSFIRVEDNGVLYLTIGYVETDKGPAFYEQAVMFCPFCGRELQSKASGAKSTQH